MGIAPVVFVEEDSQPLLGAVTLEIFRLGIDPVEMRLVPVDGLLGKRGRILQTVRQRRSGAYEGQHD